jgi:hypothetical protein
MVINKIMNKIIFFLWLIVLGILLQMNNCFAQTKTINQKLRLLVYGLPDFKRQNAENVTAQKWGIEFYSVAGCLVTKELVDSVEKHNNTVKPLIIKKYGKDWSDKFDKEVDVEFQTEKKVTALIDQLNYIKKRQAEMEKEGNGLHYIMTPVANSTKYNASIQGWGKWNGQDEWVTYYKLLVDYKAKSVKLLSDKIIKE